MKSKYIVLGILVVLTSCVPVKRSADVSVQQRLDYTRYDSLFREINQKVDLVVSSAEQSREQIAEWLNEDIDYSESKYDSLGRLVGKIEQATRRNGGKNTDRQGNTTTYIGLTTSQVDSIISVKMEKLKADLMAKDKTVERVGLSWLQKTLIYIGIASIAGLVIWLIFKFIKNTQWWSILLSKIKRS